MVGQTQGGGHSLVRWQEEGASGEKGPGLSLGADFWFSQLLVNSVTHTGSGNFHV